ncbi:NAD(P)-binding domain-containing protein [Variovorax sp. LjRoot130]|uniref:NAD(P)-binding domain-containing protein n=1 Tax=Variovorax sp. LjRoot130 TaxID=3342261 RepID=UPI003ECE4CD4
MEKVYTAIIGGGQAGLAMSRHLSCLGREHVVFERGRIAERWRSQRWDSLMFQFPNWTIALPGLSYATDEPEGFAHKDEVVLFIESYCSFVAAPVRLGVEVSALRAHSSGFELDTSEGPLLATNVVVATGPYQLSRLPHIHRDLPARLLQLHASEYRSPTALPEGAVLVVGSGASGCQIADELMESGRRVFLSVGHHRRVPRRYRGRDVFWWRRELGEWDQTVDTTPPERRRTTPLLTGVRGGYDVDLRQSAARGVCLLGRIAGVAGGRIAFAPDLECRLQEADAAYGEFIAACDALARERDGLAPREPAGERAVRALTGREDLDIEADGIAAVIWATGYELDFGWIEFPIFDAGGRPLQYRGATSVPGLYFVGLHFMHKLKSSLVSGVGEDAAHIAGLIAGRALFA